MFEAYSVGVTLKLHNLVSPALGLLAQEFEKLDKLTLTLNKSLGQISGDAKGLRSLTTATNAANRAFERANLTASAFRNHLASIHQTGGAIGVAALGSRIPPAPRLPPAGGGGGGGGGHGGGGGFHGGNIHLGAGGVGLGTVGMATGDWFWPLAASGAMVYAGKSLFESAKELDTERQRFKLLGLSDSQNADAFKYVGGLQIYGTTQAERMAAFTEAQGVGRESGLADSRALDFAKLATPVLSRLDALGKGLDDEARGALHASNVALLRFDEQAGGLRSAAEFSRLANVAYKLRQSSGGTIDFEQLRAVTARGGAYTQGKTDEGWAYAEPIIQELKGNAYGVGVQTAGTRLFNVMSRTPKNLIAEANRLGLWAPGREHLDEADSKLFKENFEKFYIERLMPLYDKFQMTPNDRIRDNAILLGRTGGTVGNLIEKQIPSIMRSWDAYQKAKSLDAATKQLPASISGQEQEFESAWTDFKANFGTTALPFFSGILKAGSAILRQMPDGSTPVGDALRTAKSFLPGASLLTSAWEWLHPGGEQDRFVSKVYGGKPFGFDSGAPSAFGSPFISPGQGQSVTVTPANVHIGAEKVATIVFAVGGKAGMGPQTGTSTYDNLMGLPNTGGI